MRSVSGTTTGTLRSMDGHVGLETARSHGLGVLAGIPMGADDTWLKGCLSLAEHWFEMVTPRHLGPDIQWGPPTWMKRR